MRRPVLPLTAGILLAVAIAVLAAGPHQYPHWPPQPRPVSPLFEPAKAEALLEGDERNGWQLPGPLVQALGLRSGDTVADIGTGSGYLLPYLSRAVGPEGRVYAEEIQPEFLPALRRHARRLGNVRVVLGGAEDPGLPAGSVDYYVLLTVYHEVQEPVRFLRTLHRSARPGARLAIIDFDASRNGYPPAPPDHDVRESDVLVEARAAGWRLEQRHELFTSQFFLVFRRAADPPEQAAGGPAKHAKRR